MARINQLTGTPWHVGKITKKEDDPRRHRSRCLHYNKLNGQCSRILLRCPGSAHCSEYVEYNECNAVKELVEQESNSKNAESIRTAKEAQSGMAEKLFPCNAVVFHKTFGKGKVVTVKNGIITIQFENDGTKQLDLATCMKNGLLSKER